MRTARSVFLTASALICFGSPTTLAGELDPPADVVAPTMKDLDDVEPRQVIRNDFDTITPIVIDSPGSYYLGENIMAIPSQHGIEITSSDVTLDLNGFTISGNTEVGSLDGIHVTGSQVNIAIVNGMVRDFFGDGIDAQDADNGRIDNVRVYNNGGAGIWLQFNAVVTDCTASSNGSWGIGISHNSVVRGCSAYENDDDGIAGGVSVSISDSTAYRNGAEGFDTANGCTITNCASRDNGLNGFDSAQRSTYLNCTAIDNTEDGFHSISAASYLNCSASSNDGDGFDVTSGLIRGCVASFNSGMNFNAGGTTQVLDSHP